jgi:hypothetical protein
MQLVASDSGKSVKEAGHVSAVADHASLGDLQAMRGVLGMVHPG